MSNPLPQARQQGSRWEPGGLQAKMAVTAGEMEHQQMAGQQAIAAEGLEIKVWGRRKINCFLNSPIQEANCKNYLISSDEKLWLPSEMSQHCTQCLFKHSMLLAEGLVLKVIGNLYCTLFTAKLNDSRQQSFCMSKKQQDEAIRVFQSSDVMSFLHYKTKSVLKKTNKQKISTHHLFFLFSVLELFLNIQSPGTQKDSLKRKTNQNLTETIALSRVTALRILKVAHYQYGNCFCMLGLFVSLDEQRKWDKEI